MTDQKHNAEAPSADGAHNRKTERLPWQEPVEFLSPVICTGHTLDIGAGGIGVEMDNALAENTLVEMKLLKGHLIAQGRIRWTHQQPNGKYRVGIQFDHEEVSILTHIRNQLHRKN